MVNCKFCTGMTELKATDEIVTHMKVQHLNVPDDDVKRLIRKVAMCGSSIK